MHTKGGNGARVREETDGVVTCGWGPEKGTLIYSTCSTSCVRSVNEVLHPLVLSPVLNVKNGDRGEGGIRGGALTVMYILLTSPPSTHCSFKSPSPCFS